ncbi:MAG: polysaccharide deacetylase family protein [Devosia sp.]
MSGWRYRAFAAAFDLLWASQITHLIRRASPCRGIIFTLHRVLPEPPAAFSPNAILQVTPDYLDYVISRMRTLGFETISLDEAVVRIGAPRPQQPFVSFSFDDAYRDNLVHALPILRRQRCPFTLYVPTAFVDGVGQVWWQALEDIVAAQPHVRFGSDEMPSATLREKEAAFAAIYAKLRRLPEPRRAEAMAEFADEYRFDLTAHCRSLIMDWATLAVFAKEPLCTLGAHTVNHAELALLSASEARNEMAQSIAILKAQFGRAPEHFSYPIGSAVAAREREYAVAKALGLKTAVTTRPGGIYARHKDRLTSLPRISLNGLFQQRRHVEVLATGALFSLMDKDPAISRGVP